MIDKITRWKLQEVSTNADGFLILDTLYGNANIYRLADLVDNPKVKLEDVFVSGVSAYILMTNSEAIELNLLTKEITTIKKSDFVKKSRSKN